MSKTKSRKKKSNLESSIRPMPAPAVKKGRSGRSLDMKKELLNLALMLGVLAGTIGIYVYLMSFLNSQRDRDFGWIAILIAFSYFKLLREKHVDREKPLKSYGLEMLRLLIVSSVLFGVLRFAIPASISPSSFLIPTFIIAIGSIVVSVFLRQAQAGSSKS